MQNILFFKPGFADAGDLPREEQVALLGVKGAFLSRMARDGVPVPEGFTITVPACKAFYAYNSGILSSFYEGHMPYGSLLEAVRLPPDVEAGVDRNLDRLSGETGRRFSDLEHPLVLSVRSGATISMPGMMATLCNVGITEEMLAQAGGTGAENHYLYDGYRAFLADYGPLAGGVQPKAYSAPTKLFARHMPDSLAHLLDEYRRIYIPPDDPRTQLVGAIKAVLISANNERTAEYRRMNYLEGEMGLAVTVQRMVFGNLNDRSGAGVAFTRDPSSGAVIEEVPSRRELMGQFVPGGQGNDIVNDAGRVVGIQEVRRRFPEAYEQLREIFFAIEEREKCIQDGEFTIEDGCLYVLQTRRAKTTPQAELRAVVEMDAEGLLSPIEAVQLVNSRQLEKLLYRQQSPEDLEGLEQIGRGRVLVPGIASGHLVFGRLAAENYKKHNEPVIFCCKNLRTEDLSFLEIVDGVVSSQENITSHATLIARNIGHPALVRSDLTYDAAQGTVQYRDGNMNLVTLKEGAQVTVDADHGKIFKGYTPLEGADLDDPVLSRFIHILSSVDTVRVVAQAEDRPAIDMARKLGATGIGNFRSDVLFFHRDINFALCDFFIHRDKPSARPKERLLRELLAAQYEAVFRHIGGGSISVRLIKHTMVEYFPQEGFEVTMLAEYLKGANPDVHPDGKLDRWKNIIRRVRQDLFDFNPIMGRRGVRLATVFPKLYELQLRAIFEAAARAQSFGADVAVELLVPYVSLVGEFLHVKNLAARVHAEVRSGAPLRYLVTPVIEISGIALELDELARHTDRILIRTDKLTTSTHHIVREDSGAYLGEYVERDWFKGDPFRIIQKSTERLVRTAIDAAKEVNPKIQILVAGNHCVNEYSLRRLLKLGIAELCCPPRMVPLVKLIAINLELAERRREGGGRGKS